MLVKVGGCGLCCWSPPSALWWGFGGLAVLPVGWVWCFAVEKRGNVRPRLGLEWWKQELSPHLRELNELNQEILSPLLDLCHLLPGGVSERAFPGAGLSPVPRAGAERPSEDTRVEVVAQGHTTALSWLGLLVANAETSTTRLTEKRLKCWVLCYFLAWHLSPFPPAPAASSLDIWREKNKKILHSCRTFLYLLPPAQCGQD